MSLDPWVNAVREAVAIQEGMRQNYEEWLKLKARQEQHRMDQARADFYARMFRDGQKGEKS